jgi:hypothetical protein
MNVTYLNERNETWLRASQVSGSHRMIYLRWLRIFLFCFVCFQFGCGGDELYTTDSGLFPATEGFTPLEGTWKCTTCTHPFSFVMTSPQAEFLYQPNETTTIKALATPSFEFNSYGRYVYLTWDTVSVNVTEENAFWEAIQAEHEDPQLERFYTLPVTLVQEMESTALFPWEGFDYQFNSRGDTITIHYSVAEKEPATEYTFTNTNTAVLQAPFIVFKLLVYKYGTALQGEMVSAPFTFTNNGKAPLEISKVQPSCGCTATRLEKTVYEPGESGVIEARFNTSHFQGEVRKGIRVQTNDYRNPELLLSLEGRITPLLEIQPRFIIFGTVSSNAEPITKPLQIILHPTFTEGGEIKTIEAPSFITVNQIDHTDHERSYAVTLDPSAAWEEANVASGQESYFLRTTLYVITTHPNSEREAIPVSANLIHP